MHCFRLHDNPWRLVQFTPRVTSGILARIFELLAADQSLNRSPLRTFCTLYLTAKHSFAWTEKRFREMTQVTLENGRTRMLDEPVSHAEPMQHVRQAEKQVSLALASALRVAPAFRLRLVGHAADLQVRVHGCTSSLLFITGSTKKRRSSAVINLRLRANELFAKLCALVACAGASIAITKSRDPIVSSTLLAVPTHFSHTRAPLQGCLMSLEQALVQLKHSETALIHPISQYATSRPADELIGSEAVRQRLTSAPRFPN